MEKEHWDLIDRYLTREITDEQLARLQDLLRADAGLRAEFRRAAALDMALSDMASMDSGSSELLMMDYGDRAPRSASVNPSGGWWLGVAAALALCCGGIFWLANQTGSPDPVVTDADAPAPVEVASILRLDNCVSSVDGQSWQEGGRLPVGEISIESGTMVFGLDDGPRIVLKGPVRLTLESEQKAFLHHGYLGFENFYDSGAFEVTTPYSVMVDIGTEYAVEVGPEGEAVRVYEGEVWRTDPKSPDNVSFIAKGQTAVFGHGEKDSAKLANVERVRNIFNDKSSVSRTPWAVEKFNYPVELGVPTQLKNGGRGWESVWRGLTRDLSMNIIRQNELTLSEGFGFGKAFRDQGKSVVLSGNSTMHRRMVNPIRRDVNGTYYFSVLFKAEASEKDGGMPSALFVTCKNSENPSTSNEDRLTAGLYKGRMLLCRYDGSKRGFVRTNIGGPNLLVGKITVSEHGDDEIRFDVIDSPEKLSYEPEWRLRKTGKTSSDQLNSVILHVVGDAPVRISEIRFGKSWESVAGEQ